MFLDTLHLDTSKVHLLVDKFLFRYESELYGCHIQGPDSLKDEDPSEVLIYVASRDYASEIINEARQMGFTKFMVFGESL